MKSILLIGAGRFGRHIAQKLSEMNHEVLAVDKNEERISAILPYVTRAQIGDSTKEEFLRSLGIRDYDVCIVTIGESFQDSLETTSLIHELGAQKVVARAARETHEKFLLRNGADEVVYPEKQLAAWTAIRYTSDHISEYVELDGDYAILAVSVPKNWAGKTVGGINIRKSTASIFWVSGETVRCIRISPQKPHYTNRTNFWFWEHILLCGSVSTFEVLP